MTNLVVSGNNSNDILPLEMLQKIFKHFPNSDLRIIGLACKTWFKTSMSLQQTRIETILRGALPPEPGGIHDIVSITFPRACLSSVYYHLKELKTGDTLPRLENMKIKGFNFPEAQSLQVYASVLSGFFTENRFVEVLEQFDPKFIEYTKSSPKLDIVLLENHPLSFLCTPDKAIISREELCSIVQTIESDNEICNFNTKQLFSNLENVIETIEKNEFISTEVKIKFSKMLLDLLLSEKEIDLAIKIYKKYTKGNQKIDAFFCNRIIKYVRENEINFSVLNFVKKINENAEDFKSCFLNSFELEFALEFGKNKREFITGFFVDLISIEFIRKDELLFNEFVEKLEIKDEEELNRELLNIENEEKQIKNERRSLIDNKLNRERKKELKEGLSNLKKLKKEKIEEKFIRLLINSMQNTNRNFNEAIEIGALSEFLEQYRREEFRLDNMKNVLITQIYFSVFFKYASTLAIERYQGILSRKYELENELKNQKNRLEDIDKGIIEVTNREKTQIKREIRTIEKMLKRSGEIQLHNRMQRILPELTSQAEAVFADRLLLEPIQRGLQNLLDNSSSDQDSSSFSDYDSSTSDSSDF